MSKKQLYNELKQKVKLSKEDADNFKFAEKRHMQNEQTFNIFMGIIKLPYVCLYKVPKKLFKALRNQNRIKDMDKEIKRLERVIKSKERARKTNFLEIEKYEKYFEQIGFKDKLNNYPVLHEINRKEDRETVSFRSNIPLSEWINKKDRLETAFNTTIVTISQRKDKQIVYIDKTDKEMPKLLSWKDEYLVKDGVFPIGKDIFGNLITFEFTIVANILVGGAPRGGKTKLFQLLGYQILRSGANLIIAEFKGVDYQKFENKCWVINEHKELLGALKKLRKEMEKRRKLFRKVSAENIDDYNKKTKSNLKRYYLLIDELGEAMEIVNPDMTKNSKDRLEKDIAELAKSGARLYSAFGIHFVFGTQRPDVRVIEGQTRDQFIGRICFKAVKNTSNIVLESDIASNLNSDDKGRAYIKIGADYKEVQVFLFTEDMIRRIPNKKLSKEDLKIVKSENENREIDEVIDVNID